MPELNNKEHPERETGKQRHSLAAFWESMTEDGCQLRQLRFDVEAGLRFPPAAGDWKGEVLKKQGSSIFSS